MSRKVWFVAGAGAGVYAMTRARRLAEALTPDGLADRLAGLSLGVRLLRDEVAAGTAAKEEQLRRSATRELSARHSAAAPYAPDNSATKREGID